MKVFVGRWSEIEMSNPSAISEMAPQRMVATDSREQAIAILGCSESWFARWFRETLEPVLVEKAMASPCVVLQSCIEILYDKIPFERIIHWVPLGEVEALTRQITNKLLAEVAKQWDGGPKLNPFAGCDDAKLAERIVELSNTTPSFTDMATRYIHLIVGPSGEAKSLMDRILPADQSALQAWMDKQTPGENGSIDLIRWPGWAEALRAKIQASVAN